MPSLVLSSIILILIFSFNNCSLFSFFKGSLTCGFCYCSRLFRSLNLFSRPVLLPCNHIFCNSCLPSSTELNVSCPVCKSQFADEDLRHMPYTENMVTIYRCLDASMGSSVFNPVTSGMHNIPSDVGKVNGKGSLQSVHGGDSNSSQSIFLACGNKQDSIPFPIANFFKDGVDKNEKGCRGGTPADAKSQEVSRGMSGTDERHTAVEIDINPVMQTSPDSSFCDAQFFDNVNFYPCSEHSSYNSLVKRTRENNSRTGKLRDNTSASGNDMRDIKRQNRSNHKLDQMDMSSSEQVSRSGNVAVNPEMGPVLNIQPSVQATNVSDASFDNDANATTCAFCQSSKITEATGRMLHYSGGKLVVGDEATHSNVLHVHQFCFDWAPQVFYEGDTIKNLKAEVARGAKIKCSRCGKKGAALGCYVNSCRRSYHVPCALEISKCRWDINDYLLLCPAHSSIKFPSEKSGKQMPKKHVEPAKIRCQPCNNWLTLSNGEKEWVLCGSSLSNEEKTLLVNYGKISGATVSKFWKQNVTHVIVATDEEGACTRTLKVLMAILNSRWVVKIDWIRACMEAKCHIDEEPYEVNLDNYGSRNGPKSGRLRALNYAPKLLSGLNFYFAGDFMEAYKEDLKDLVIAAGGTVSKSKEEVVAQNGNQQAAQKTLVVYNIDPPEECLLEEGLSKLWQRVNEAKDVAGKTGSQVIGHTWLLNSIATHELQPIS